MRRAWLGRMPRGVRVAVAPAALVALASGLAPSAYGNDRGTWGSAAPSTQAGPGGYGVNDAANRRERFLDRPVPAPSQAIEVSSALGYRQGTGSVADGAPVRDIAGPGFSLQIDAGWRASPRWFVGGFVSGTEYRPGGALAGGSARGVTAGASAALHFRPGKAMDPWFGLGTGLQFLWLSPPTGSGDRIDGLDLARVSVGIDYRALPELAFGPFVAVDTVLSLSAPELEGVRASGQGMSLYVSGGLGVRFDLLGLAVGNIARSVSPDTWASSPLGGGTRLTEVAP